MASYTELEWSLQLQALAAGDYEFRVYANDLPLGAYAVTPHLTVSGAVNYNETGRSILVVAAVTATDRQGDKELARSIPVTGTVTATDFVHRKDLALPLPVTAAVTVTELARLRELALTIPVTAATTVTERSGYKQLALSVPVAATVTVTDTYSHIGNFSEINRSILITGTTTAVDQADLHETALSVPATATTTVTSAVKAREPSLSITAVGTTTLAVDRAAYKNLSASLLIVCFVSETDLHGAPGHFDETQRSVFVTVSVTKVVDSAHYKETGTVLGPDESLYPASFAASNPSDPNTFMVGNRLTVLADGQITAIRFYSFGQTASRYVALWSDTGVLLASGYSSSEVPGWNLVSITPVTVTAGQVLRPAYGYAGNAAAGGFAFTMTPPPGSANLRWEGGAYTTPLPSGGEDDYPDQTIVPNNYFGDVVFHTVTLSTLSVVVTTTATDSKRYVETNRSITATATTTVTDRLHLYDPLSLLIAATFDAVSQADYEDHPVSITAAAIVSLSIDRAGRHELSMPVGIISITTLTYRSSYQQLALPVGVTAGTSMGDSLHAVLLFSVLVVAIITGTDFRSRTGVVVLNDADAIYLGDEEVDFVFVGADQVWP